MSQIWKAPKVDKYVNQVDILVLTCIDPRFTYFLTWFLNHEKDINDNYDLFALAGSSLCADTDTSTNPGTLPDTGPWFQSFDDHIELALALHKIKEVWIFDHLDCGAYKGYFNDDSRQKHIDTMALMKDHILSSWSDLKVKQFLMNTNGDIELIENSGGLKVFHLSSYYPEIKYKILFWIFFSLFISFILISGGLYYNTL